MKCISWNLVNAKSSKLRVMVVESVVACAVDLHRQCVSLVENLHKTGITTAILLTVRGLLFCPCVINNLVVPVDTESTPLLSGLWIIMQLCVDIVKSVFGNGNVSTTDCHPASQDWRIRLTAASRPPLGNKRAWANQEKTDCHWTTCKTTFQWNSRVTAAVCAMTAISVQMSRRFFTNILQITKWPW